MPYVISLTTNDLICSFLATLTMLKPVNHLFKQTLKVASCDRFGPVLMVTWELVKVI